MQDQALLVVYDFYAQREKQLAAIHTPTFFFIDAGTGEIVDSTEGFMEPEEFLAMLGRALKLQDRSKHASF